MVAAPDTIPQPLFPLGEVIGTPGILELMSRLEPGTISELLRRHARGDWGDMGPVDRRANDLAVEIDCGRQVVSSYRAGGLTVWVITEADRSRTTIMLPSEH